MLCLNRLELQNSSVLRLALLDERLHLCLRLRADYGLRVERRLQCGRSTIRRGNLSLGLPRRRHHLCLPSLKLQNTSLLRLALLDQSGQPRFHLCLRRRLRVLVRL